MGDFILQKNIVGTAIFTIALEIGASSNRYFLSSINNSSFFPLAFFIFFVYNK